MKIIKKYTGTDMSEIMQRIKMELGKDALILNTVSKSRKLLPGLVYEVNAGILEDRKGKDISPESGTKIPLQQLRTTEMLPNPKIEVLQQGITEIKHALRVLQQTKQSETSGLETINPDLISIEQKFFDRGMDMVLWKKIKQALPRVMNDKAETLWNYEEILEKIQYLYHIGFQKIKHYSESTSNVHCFVGPTGSGKTTTIAKLASKMVLERKKRVVLISLDQFRLGGVDQLKQYANILGAPFYSIDDELKLRQCLAHHNEEYEIFIDTSGTSPKGREHFQKMCNYISMIPYSANIYLTLPANSSRIDVETIISRFKPCRYNQTVITKVDEAVTLLHLLTLRFVTFPGISYYTDGQMVPDDLHRFSSEIFTQKTFDEFKPANKAREMVSP